MAQEPPALRPRIEAAPTKPQLEALLQGLEALLAMPPPPPPLEAPPAEVEGAFDGTFIRDWRHLDTRQHVPNLTAAGKVSSPGYKDVGGYICGSGTRLNSLFHVRQHASRGTLSACSEALFLLTSIHVSINALHAHAHQHRQDHRQ